MTVFLLLVTQSSSKHAHAHMSIYHARSHIPQQRLSGKTCSTNTTHMFNSTSHLNLARQLSLTNLQTDLINATAVLCTQERDGAHMSPYYAQSADLHRLCATGFDTSATWPAVQLHLADEQGDSLCRMTLTVTGTGQQDKLVHATALYQNAVECIPKLTDATSLQFSVSEDNQGGSFCLDNLGFLRSMLQTEGTHKCDTCLFVAEHFCGTCYSIRKGMLLLLYCVLTL